MKVNFVNLLLGFATVLGVSTSLATAIPLWEFYFDVTSAQHQANFTKLFPMQRMISLSVYGQPPNHRYAAVWVQRPGPLYFAIQEASDSAYQSFFDSHAPDGYVSTIITVTGPPSAPIFAGVMEKNGVTDWYQRCGLTTSQYSAELNKAQADRYILKSFTEYGSPSARLYCGVWYHNDQWDKYTTFVSQSYTAYQTTSNAEETKPFWRPSYLSVSEDRAISSTFVDTDVGSWVARHGMTASSLQSEYETQKAAGRYIIHLQGGGTGSDTNFAALWATQDIPTERTWRVTGSVTGFQNNDAASSQADGFMQAFMKANGVRQAQFSVAKKGITLLQRGYSWSEATRHTTTTSDVFLLASLSKIFLEATIQVLYNSNKLSNSTKVYPLLGYVNTVDPRLQSITVNHLLTHVGGLNDTKSGFDPTYNMSLIAAARNTGPNPATIKDVVDYMSLYTLDYDPGDGPDQYAYSNYGYLLLSYVVEHVTGMSYYDYLSSAVLAPGGHDVRKWPTSPSAHVNDPITQESKYTGLNAATPQSETLIAAIFGGDAMYKDDCYGSAALAASANTLVDFIYTHAVWGIGPRVQNFSRAGSTPGASTFANSTLNDLDWSVTVNTRDFPPSSGAKDPFFDILCGSVIPGFLGANPAA